MTKSQEIYVLNKKLKLKQPDEGFRTSLDSIMLAAACPAQSTDHILDMGSGVGSAGLCLLYRLSQAYITGVDIQEDHIQLANENAQANQMADQTKFIVSDISSYQSDSLFDHVICNPPYLEAGDHLQSPSSKKQTAIGNKDLSIDDWITRGFHNLKSKGSLTVIHRTDRADKIIQALGKRFGAIEIIPLWPKFGQISKRVIIRARKDRKDPAVIHPGLILHQEDGSYTQEADAILRDGKNLC